jgi:hyaluronan synthase
MHWMRLAAARTEARDLGPQDRALLELSSRHGLSDAEVAGIIGRPAEEVAERRRVLARMHRAETARTPKDSRIFDLVLRVVAVAYLAVLLAAIVLYKAAFLKMVAVDPLFGVYGAVVAVYIVSRFLLSLGYRPVKGRWFRPRVAIVMPAFNEEEAVGESLRSLLRLRYPSERLELVAVNDGSTDGTIDELRAVEREAGGRVRVIDFERNRGKRAAMAAGIRATDAEIIAFVDSDSVLEPDALTQMVLPFTDERVGAVCGHARVLNARESWMTKMQAVRYFVAFRVIKAAESIFGAVTCCSGCFSAYRREAVAPRLDGWEHQKFLGNQTTFGDDRSLTNCVLRNWRVRYQSTAVSHTIVPDNFRKFMRQQLRWKRSWTRESLIVGSFIWRKHPVAAAGTYVGALLPLIAPIVAVRALVWHPVVAGAGASLIYLAGLYAMALVYGLYYALSHPRYDGLWFWGVAFSFFYIAFLLWQTYYAVATSRRTGWGTRPSGGAGPSGGVAPRSPTPPRRAFAAAEAAP